MISTATLTIRSQSIPSPPHVKEMPPLKALGQAETDSRDEATFIADLEQETARSLAADPSRWRNGLKLSGRKPGKRTWY